MNKQIKHEIDELLCLEIEGAASPEQTERLNELMESGLDVQQYVVNYFYLSAALHKSSAVASGSLGTRHEINELYRLLRAMAREEKTAPSLKIVSESEIPDDDYGKIVVLQPAQKINRLSLGITIASVAAFLLLLAYIHMIPPRESVAVLKDSIAARWQGGKESIQEGVVFYNTDTPRVLKEGFLEIEFDYGARVVLEGPSEFVCKSDNQILLNFGRLYARVPSQATGFTVETLNSRIVDLGTEFGVQANIDGTIELHVIKGHTKLLTGLQKDEAYSVSENQALVVSADGASVDKIALKKNSFVQQINSEVNIVRKGQRHINLADITGGGNGFGTGRRNVGLSPITGEIGEIYQADRNRKTDNTYHSVSMHPFIDGVFVPNGLTKQVISSQGHVFIECPATQGNYFTEISSTPRVVDRAEIVLGGVNYSQTEELGSLFLHANLGITYDLQAIRSQLGNVHLTHFRSDIGVCESSWRPCNADFWILVDGQLRYRRESVQQKGILDTVEIELSENDRFLTLVTTDGGDPDADAFKARTVTSMDSDWCLFAEPVLVIE